jgi:hypothetical protein
LGIGTFWLRKGGKGPERRNWKDADSDSNAYDIAMDIRNQGQVGNEQGQVRNEQG